MRTPQVLHTDCIFYNAIAQRSTALISRLQLRIGKNSKKELERVNKFPSYNKDMPIKTEKLFDKDFIKDVSLTRNFKKRF